MSHKRDLNPFFRMFGIVVVLVIAVIAAGIGLFYYIFAIPEPEGLSLASWPNTFTENFSLWLESEKGNITVEDKGIQYLDEYGLWLQVVDENGQEVYSYHKPENCPVSYSALELMNFHTDKSHTGSTVFTGKYENSGEVYGYFIGFPYAIGERLIYYNGENVDRLYPVLRIAIVVMLGGVFVLTLFYGFWLSKHLGKITNSIRNITERTYIRLQGKGVFANVYTALNEMDKEIRRSDKLQKDTEKVRREWITNITHDVKTPLSPIKGYAELLANNQVPEGESAREYGEIILKNAVYTEKLINDLKMTYQFEAGGVPLSPQKVYLVRYIRECVIDIINDPAFSDRNIEFESTEEDVDFFLDPELFRRALGNIIVNALTHNLPETKVIVRVETDAQDKACIHVSDNGTGMSEEEMSELFERYYRGTNTKEKPEGSGLGLAIAKQIITLHGGGIEVSSRQNEGTEFLISLPLKS